MATFSINQVNHLFVVNETKSGKIDVKAKVGTIFPQADKAKESMYFQYIGAGGPQSTDKITIKNIEKAKATSSKDLSKNLKRFEVTLDKNVNEGKPIVNQDYLLRLSFRHYIGISEEDTYLKHGVVHGVKNMTASDFYKTMAVSIVNAVARDLNKLIKVYVVTDSEVEVEVGQKVSDIVGDATKIILEEVAQDWRLGIIKQEVIPFVPQPVTVTFEGSEVLWGVVEEVKAKNVIPNGTIIADLEYFSMGARGDMYRKVGFPHNIDTRYLVDPTKEYDALNIHYSFIGDGVSTQKSEKDLTLVAVNDGSHTLMNALITEINKVSGLTIEALV